MLGFDDAVSVPAQGVVPTHTGMMTLLLAGLFTGITSTLLEIGGLGLRSIILRHSHDVLHIVLLASAQHRAAAKVVLSTCNSSDYLLDVVE